MTVTYGIFYNGVSGTYKDLLHPIVKLLLKHKDETCLNLSLVTLLSPDPIRKVDNLTSAERFYAESMPPSKSFPDGRDLYEFLKLFKDSIHSPQRRTLVIFFTFKLEQIHLDILDKLQTEDNVVVILVSLIYDISEIKHIPRHLKFFSSHWGNQNLHLKQIVDVIKNPDYNRFTFNKHLTSIKNRSCLEKLKVIPVVSSYNQTDESDGFLIKHLFNKIILPMKHRQILTVQPLLDRCLIESEEMNISNLPFNKYYESDLGNLTSFSQLEQTGIMNGTQRNIFLLFQYCCTTDMRMLELEKLLEKNKQIVSAITIMLDLESFQLTSYTDNTFILHWRDGKVINDIDDIICLLYTSPSPRDS